MTDETKPNHDPVSLGSGSYDFNALQEATDKIAQENPADREAVLQSTLEKLDKTDTAKFDPRDVDGYSWRTRTNAAGGKERIQVATPEKADASEEETVAAEDGKAPVRGTTPTTVSK